MRINSKRPFHHNNSLSSSLIVPVQLCLCRSLAIHSLWCTILGYLPRSHTIASFIRLVPSQRGRHPSSSQANRCWQWYYFMWTMVYRLILIESHTIFKSYFTASLSPFRVIVWSSWSCDQMNHAYPVWFPCGICTAGLAAMSYNHVADSHVCLGSVCVSVLGYSNILEAPVFACPFGHNCRTAAASRCKHASLYTLHRKQT